MWPPDLLTNEQTNSIKEMLSLIGCWDREHVLAAGCFAICLRQRGEAVVERRCPAESRGESRRCGVTPLRKWPYYNHSSWLCAAPVRETNLTILIQSTHALCPDMLLLITVTLCLGPISSFFCLLFTTAEYVARNSFAYFRVRAKLLTLGLGFNFMVENTLELGLPRIRKSYGPGAFLWK